MPYDLGVDLGTTSTAASIMRDGHLTVCRLGATSHVIPSVVSIREDGTVLTGEGAERRAVSDPSRTVREFKRRLGDETPYVIGGTPYGAEVLTGYLLREVATSVSATEGEPPRRIALAHPATWGAFKIELLADAVRLAEVPNAVFVPEPVAAAIAYSQSNRLPAGSALLVYDFGGGTFDAAVVRLTEDDANVVGVPEGLARLGGIDFDLIVLSHVDAATGGAASSLDTDEPEARAALARLRDDCRQAKEALSSDTEAEIPVILPNVRTTVRLTRSELEALVAPRLADTGAVMDRVVAGAGLTYDDLAGILLVGGTSRMPLIADFVRGHTGRAPTSDVDPLLAIANGAALVAGSGAQVPSIVATDGEVGAAAAALAGVVASVEDEGHDAAPEGEDGVAPSETDGEEATPDEDGDVAAERGPKVMPSQVGSHESAPGHGRRRAVRGAVAALVLAAAGGVAFASLDSGDVQQTGEGIGSSGETTTTAEPDTATTTDDDTGGPSGSTPTSGGGGPVATATTATTRPTTPYFEELDTPSSVSCAGMAPSARVDVQVAWKAQNADSVTVAIDQPGQIWETGLPTEGSTSYTVTCDGSQTSTTAIVTAKGPGDSGKTESVLIPITF